MVFAGSCGRFGGGGLWYGLSWFYNWNLSLTCRGAISTSTIAANRFSIVREHKHLIGGSVGHRRHLNPLPPSCVFESTNNIVSPLKTYIVLACCVGSTSGAFWGVEYKQCELFSGYLEAAIVEGKVRALNMCGLSCLDSVLGVILISVVTNTFRSRISGLYAYWIANPVASSSFIVQTINNCDSDSHHFLTDRRNKQTAAHKHEQTSNAVRGEVSYIERAWVCPNIHKEPTPRPPIPSISSVLFEICLEKLSRLFASAKFTPFDPERAHCE